MAAQWIAILQGNSHHHWGWFDQNQQMIQVKTYPALQSPPLPLHSEIWLAKVAGADPPSHPNLHPVTLEHIPLSGLYATLGVDRALALMAAGQLYQWPVLVIDGGTALTLSAVDPGGTFAGGAILPGIMLQAQALHQFTDALPLIDLTVGFADLWPIVSQRWAYATPEAMSSGILNTLLSGLKEYSQAWLQQYPQSAIVVTGGDGLLIFDLLKQIPQVEWQGNNRLYWEPHLILYGIAVHRQALL